MHVRVLLFAGLRERAGADQIELELPDGALRRATRSQQLRALTDGVPVVMAVNQEYADGRAPLHAGDELALIPPRVRGVRSARCTCASLRSRWRSTRCSRSSATRARARSSPSPA